jgi:hypothetical protein
MILPQMRFFARISSAVLGLVLTSLLHASETTAPRAHRLVVLTDVENEPDDTQSLVRLMLYSNVIDLQGLVATTSVHMKEHPSPQSIRRVIDAYGKVRNNLLQHESGFPEVATLQALVKSGAANYGMQAVEPQQESEGSEWIIHLLDQADDRPLWVTAWGGPNTLAQALHKLRATRTEAELKRLVAKLRVYTISDQDDSGPWIRKNFPELFYIVSPGGYGAATWTGIMQVEAGFDNSTISNRWLAENIQQGHGPLGALYPDVAYGREGDTPSFLALIPNGLNVPEHPEWGGWGGRYERSTPELSTLDPQGFTGGVPVDPEARPIWTNAVDEYAPPLVGEYGRALRVGEKSMKSFRATIWRWRDDFQRDFAARMAWTTQPRAGANHPPVPVLAHLEAVTIKSGERFFLDAHASTDPDGDSLSFWWFPYPEAGTYRGKLSLQGAQNIYRVGFVAPQVEKPETAHFILRLTDKGTPALTRYKRVIVTIVP